MRKVWSNWWPNIVLMSVVVGLWAALLIAWR
jgi:hypothetical protein